MFSCEIVLAFINRKMETILNVHVRYNIHDLQLYNEYHGLAATDFNHRETISRNGSESMKLFSMKFCLVGKDLGEYTLLNLCMLVQYLIISTQKQTTW